MRTFLYVLIVSIFASSAYADERLTFKYVERFKTGRLMTMTAQQAEDQAKVLKAGGENVVALSAEVALTTPWLSAIAVLTATDEQIFPFYRQCVERQRKRFYSKENEKVAFEEVSREFSRSKQEQLLQKRYAGILAGSAAAEYFCAVRPFIFLLYAGGLDVNREDSEFSLKRIPGFSHKKTNESHAEVIRNVSGVYQKTLSVTRDLTPQAVNIIGASMQLSDEDFVKLLWKTVSKASGFDFDSLAKWAANVNQNLGGPDADVGEALIRMNPEFRAMQNIMNNMFVREINELVPATPDPVPGLSYGAFLNALRLRSQYRNSQDVNFSSGFPNNWFEVYELNEAFSVLDRLGCDYRQSTFDFKGITVQYPECDRVRSPLDPESLVKVADNSKLSSTQSSEIKQSPTPSPQKNKGQVDTPPPESPSKQGAKEEAVATTAQEPSVVQESPKLEVVATDQKPKENKPAETVKTEPKAPAKTQAKVANAKKPSTNIDLKSDEGKAWKQSVDQKVLYYATYKPKDNAKNLESVFDVELTESGFIIGVKLSKTSGDKDWDQAVERAIWASSSWPLPKTQKLKSPVTLTFAPGS